MAPLSTLAARVEALAAMGHVAPPYDPAAFVGRARARASARVGAITLTLPLCASGGSGRVAGTERTSRQGDTTCAAALKHPKQTKTCTTQRRRARNRRRSSRAGHRRSCGRRRTDNAGTGPLVWPRGHPLSGAAFRPRVVPTRTRRRPRPPTTTDGLQDGRAERGSPCLSGYARAAGELGRLPLRARSDRGASQPSGKNGRPRRARPCMSTSNRRRSVYVSQR